MSEPETVDPNTKIADIAEKVSRNGTPLTVRTASGKAVKVIPVPEPIGYRKGVPIYKAEDIQYLYLDNPYWFE
ncbi:MAG: hypothetical protein AAB288_10850 [Acidobacteriota bacterium]